MLDLLSERIWNNSKFHQDVRNLLVKHLRKSVLREHVDPIDRDALIRLSRSAAIMAGSSRQAHRNIAYRIAVAATSLFGESEPATAEIMLLVLNRLGNFPASRFAMQRHNVSISALPARVAVESEVHRLKNSTIIGDTEISFTDFQCELWNDLNENLNVSVSAPTSAGKSFVVQAFLREAFQTGAIKHAAYLVPSRALVNQVAADVGSWLSSIDANVPELFTVPFTSETLIPPRAVYVMTQERFQLVQSSHEELKLDVLIADEVQGIGEGPRGILLSSVIEEAIKRQQKLKVLFAGPNLANPAHLGDVFDIAIHPVKTQEPTVSQNLFLVRTADTGQLFEIASDKVAISLVDDGEVSDLGVSSLSHPITRELDKYVHIPTALGSCEQSLVYVNGPSMAETVAFGIADVTDSSQHEVLNELSRLAAEAVHPHFQLVETIKKGVGFHYGRLPALVRQSLEKAFGEGHLRYLVTTSTLLQGVNLPAKNLFLYKPHRGPDTPITSIDFWNLAGRAGRLGKEFEGNVFLIDYPLWESAPLDGQREETVNSSLQQHVVVRSDELLEYVKSRELSPTRDKQDDMENTFVKLFSDFQAGTLMRTLGRVGLAQGDERSIALEAALKEVASFTTLSTETVSASPTVSVYRQQALYDRLQQSVKKKGIDYIMPKHPQSVGGYNSLVAIFKRCHDELFNYPRSDKSHTYFASLAFKWMRGEVIPQIIDGSMEYQRKKGKKPKLPTVIRDVLKEIEKDLRFKYVRALSCYVSVLKQILRENNREDLIKSIPSIPLYMEVGAVNQTMISLMGIGVSRFTANKLQAIIGRTDMSQTGVRDWLRSRNVRALDIPVASADELSSMGLTTIS